MVAFCAKSSVNDWYFINLVPRSAFLTGSRTSMLVIVCSFAVYIFGITFALIQKRFVIGPIRELVVKIDRVKEGDFTEEDTVYPGDEIGALNQEFGRDVPPVKEADRGGLYDKNQGAGGRTECADCTD